MIRLYIIGLIVFLIGAHSSQALVHYIGQAYDADSGDFLYTDSYKESWSKEGVLVADVTYSDPSGNLIATKHIRYTANKAYPEFQLKNYVDNSEEGALVDKKTATIYRQKKTDKTAYTEVLNESSVIDAGFHYFILQHWGDLEIGMHIDAEFLLPKHGRMTFIISEYLREGWKDSETVVYKAELQNFFFRLLIPPIFVRYDLKTKQLLQFKGITNLELGDNKRHYIVMDIHHK